MTHRLLVGFPKRAGGYTSISLSEHTYLFDLKAQQLYQQNKSFIQTKDYIARLRLLHQGRTQERASWALLSLYFCRIL